MNNNIKWERNSVQIEVKNLCHHYVGAEDNQPPALDHVNLTIDEGEFVAIIGTNGSGKSTLAKHLNGLLLPSEGECLVDGMSTLDYEYIWDIRQKVGMVFQNPDNQLVATVVEEDVAFGPENNGVPPEEIRRRVDDALRRVGMEAFRDHAPHRLSGGQKQRIAIAGALAMDSRWLVLDEPTAMLDPQGRQEVLGIVKRLHKEEGIGIVYITHYMEEAVAADRVVVMKNGVILTEGTPHEIFTQTKMLEELGLTVPVATLLADRLRAAGLDLPQNIITDEELAVALCQLR